MALSSYLLGALACALIVSVSYSIVAAPLRAVIRQSRYVWCDLIVPAIAAAFAPDRMFPRWLVRGEVDAVGMVHRSQVIHFQAQRERRVHQRRQAASSGSIGAGLIAA